MLNEFKNMLGMDSNSFYPAVLTACSIILPVLISCLKVIGNRMGDNLWTLHKKNKGDIFFSIIMSLEAISAGSWFILLEFLNIFLISFDVPDMCRKILFFIVEVLGVGINIILVLNFPFIKMKILGNSKGKCLIISSVITMHILFLIVLLRINYWLIIWSPYILIMIIECWGLKAFKGYTQYDYSCIRIFLNNGDVIDCHDISKIRRKYNSLIIGEKDMQIRIRYDSILRMEYYGDMKIII